MKRRKFLVGMGSLAAGGAAAMGTGAFESVSAERDVFVTIAGDRSAYLTLEPTSPQAQMGAGDRTGEMVLGFDKLNTAAETALGDVFSIQNRGTDGVYVWIATNDWDSGGAKSVEVVAGSEEGVGTNRSQNAQVDISAPPGHTGGGEISSNGPSRTPGGWVYLNAGESTSVDINFFVNDADPQTFLFNGDPKNWQFNADRDEPDDSDYNDSTNLKGH